MCCWPIPAMPVGSRERGKGADMIYKLSCVGNYHAAAGEGNQDALCSADRGESRVISLADGVSTCCKARAGAEIASRVITELMAEEGQTFLRRDDAEWGRQILGHILSRLEKRSQREGNALKDYSSTVASVLVDQEKGELLYFNLGDSLILGVDRGKCRVLSMPGDSSQGCCVTTTKNAAAGADMGKVSVGTTERVLICSDGAWRELYRRNRLRPEVSSLLAGGEWKELKRFFRERNCGDDYSVIAMEL